MNARTLLNLNADKLRKVHALITGGATKGERTAAKISAEKMVRRASMPSEADMKILQQQNHVPVQNGCISTSDRRKAVLSILNSEPELSDREIARRAGVSPQTVGNWRGKRKAA